MGIVNMNLTSLFQCSGRSECGIYTDIEIDLINLTRVHAMPLLVILTVGSNWVFPYLGKISRNVQCRSLSRGRCISVCICSN